jgi:tRNA acetyltransferase TAN1
VVSLVVTLERFNLLVTFHPNQAGLAEREVRKRVEDVGGHVEDIERSSIDGVFCVRLAGDAKEIVSSLHSEFQEAPEMLVHTYHWVPIDVWVEANEEVMIDTVKDLAQGIGENEKWMMHVHKRHHPKHSEELMLTLTGPIRKGKVDLKHPEKIIVVEVLGGMAGLSLLAKDQLINVNRLRQEIGLTLLV